MPSGSIVAIDPAYNDVAILDASACAPAAASTTTTTSDVGVPGEPKEVAKVSQSQGDDEDDDEVEVVDPRQVSPMPPRRANMVTPRPTRRPASSSGKAGGGDVKSKSFKRGDGEGPATPPPPNKLPNAASSVVVVDTPGEEESAIKEKREGVADASSSKKPSKTLHSFFGRADPSARKGKKESVVKSSGGGSRATSTKAIKASSKKESKKTPAGEGSSKSPERPAAKASEKPAAKPKEKPIAAAEEAAGNFEAEKKTPKKKNTTKAEGRMVDAKEGEDVVNKPSEPSKNPKKSASAPSKSSKKTKKSASVKNRPAASSSRPTVVTDCEELDDSPAHAVAVAMRTLTAGGRRRGCLVKKGREHKRGVAAKTASAAPAASAVTAAVAPAAAADAVAAEKGAKEELVEVVELEGDEDVEEIARVATAKGVEASENGPSKTAAEKVKGMPEEGAVVRAEVAAEASDVAGPKGEDEPNVAKVDGVPAGRETEDTDDGLKAGEVTKTHSEEAGVEDVDAEVDDSAVDREGAERCRAAGETAPPEPTDDGDVAAAKGQEHESDGGDVVDLTGLDPLDETEVTEETASSDKQSNAEDIIDVDCEEGKSSSALEEKSGDSANDFDIDEATVMLEDSAASEKSHAHTEVCAKDGLEVPGEINQPQNTHEDASKKKSNIRSDDVQMEEGVEDVPGDEPTNADDLTDAKKDSPEDEAVVIADNTKKSILDELPTEGDNVEVSDRAAKDEVVVVEPRAPTSKPAKSKRKVGTKSSQAKSRKKALALSNKSSKRKKALSAVPEKKGLSPIAASLQKLAACPPKQSKPVLSSVAVTAEKMDEEASSIATSSKPLANAADKAAAAPEKKKGLSPIAACLKKLEACQTKKKSKAEPAERSPVPALGTTYSKGGAASATATATVRTDDEAESSAVAAKADAADASAAASTLSEEDASRLKHYAGLREKYVARATELGERPGSDDFDEESLSLKGVEELAKLDEGSVEVAEDGTFPDALLTHLSLIVQGRSLPLSALAKRALGELSAYTANARPLIVTSISSKIKLLAQRKSYLSGRLPATPSEKSIPISKLDCFENDEECYMWRWELVSIDLLPQKEAAKVKKARTMRKKLQGHHRAIVNLIAAVDKAATWLQNNPSKDSAAAGEKLVARVSETEEKVLKFEREEEKARLLKDAKIHKQRSKAEELAEKQRERDTEKKRREEEKAAKKLEAVKEREEAKRKKVEEKELEKQKKQLELEEKENKRKARMMSFFHKGNSKKKQRVVSGRAGKGATGDETQSFDGDAFRRLIDSRDEHAHPNPFTKLLPRSRASRRCRTAKVRVSVFVTVLSENAFAPQPYDEERVIVVPNRYKFLGFHEDVRPPYHGTWSKSSKLVTGRRPFGKDSQYLDYENDSEEEWEEGDDDEGEDLQDGDGNDDEEEDVRDEEDNDGWLAAEDDLGLEDEDEDEETREMRKKKLSEATSSSARPNHFKACVVAPRMGGLSHEDFSVDNLWFVAEGFSPQDAADALASHVGCMVTPEVSNICLDAFPPTDPPKETAQAKKDSSLGPGSQGSKEMTTEAQVTMAKFIHNATQYKSKENLVTELLRTHPSVTNTRARAMRELDVIADKRRLAGGGGVVWEVKAEHLKELGLKMKDLKSPPKESSPPKASDSGDKPKKDPNAPKRNMSAYILYSNATRNEVRAANPNASFGEMAQILSKNFKALSSEERASWDERAAEDKERYQKEMSGYSKVVPTSKEQAAGASMPTNASKGQTSKPSMSKKKRKKSDVSVASAKMFASFLKKKPKTA
mmetsp:Transcript_34893/g.74427  ORF Transcript_34893/g.74427 Transcript_34893/m.74427 type:complete len:1789 (-) Transcript_34893:188-5554(-)